MRKQQTKQGQLSSRSPDSGKSADQQTQKNVHGEGNYAASKQYNDATRNFVKSGRVDKAAHDAAPKSDADARQMQDAHRHSSLGCFAHSAATARPLQGARA